MKYKDTLNTLINAAKSHIEKEPDPERKLMIENAINHILDEIEEEINTQYNNGKDDTPY